MKTVLFVCVHNAGRSQMAEALFNHLAQGSAKAISAGTKPSVRGLNPRALAVMQELGIDMSNQKPKPMTEELVRQSDKIVTMGCSVDADACPAGTVVSEDWRLHGPTGQPIEVVRRIRDEIREKVQALLTELQ